MGADAIVMLLFSQMGVLLMSDSMSTLTLFGESLDSLRESGNVDYLKWNQYRVICLLDSLF